jgi:hypothetical protein
LLFAFFLAWFAFLVALKSENGIRGFVVVVMVFIIPFGIRFEF